MDTMANVMLTNSWLKFVDMSLFTMCVVIRIQSSNIDIFDPEVPVASINVSCVQTCCTLDVCIHIATHTVNNGTSTNFNQQYVNIILAIITILLYF
jgi:hypothetical protein